MQRTIKTMLFQFKTATILIGPMELGFKLTSEDHDIGFAENVRVVKETSYVDLPAGITKQVVAQMTNKELVKVSAEIHAVMARIDSLGFDVNWKFGVQIWGVDVVTQRSVIIRMPKCKIVNRCAASVLTDNRSTLLLEFEPYVLVATDPGYSPDSAQMLSVFTPDKIGPEKLVDGEQFAGCVGLRG